MKKIVTLILASLSIFSTEAQVGINTKNPQSTLDVEGEILVESYLIDTTNYSATQNYFLLTRSKDTAPIGKLKMLDISLRNVAPVNAYKIVLTNVNQDEVVSLNTGLETSKYVIAITGATFSSAISAANTSTTPKSFGAYSTEVTQVTSGGKTYDAVNLSFKGSDTVSSANGTWTLNLNVFERSLVKDWGTVNGSVSAPSYSGVSTNTPLGLQ